MRVLKVLICLIAGLISGGYVHGQSNLVLFISSPGEYIGQGKTYVTTNTADFSVSGTPSFITVNAFGYYFWIDGPGSSNLTVGLYENSARYPFNFDSPGLSIVGNGRGCNTECGDFVINEIHTDSSGNIDRLWIIYTNHCECSSSSMTGEIRYNSTLAPDSPTPKTICVPADYSTIQEAINAADVLGGDTVLVSPGTYSESINFSGKALKLLSVSGTESTIISPPSGNSSVIFESGETSNSVISGFTLTNGGLYLNGSSPLITSNIIINSDTGVYCNFASPTVISNEICGCSGNAFYLGGAATAIIKSNIIENNGGGISMFAAGTPQVACNWILNNSGDALNGYNWSDVDLIQNVIVSNSGSALSFLVPSGCRGPLAVNNTIVNNGAGVTIVGFDGNSKVINNILVGPSVVNISYFNSYDVPVFQNNDIYSVNGDAFAGVLTNLTGINGNISINPCFTCQTSGDYHLLENSPCIDAGTNEASSFTNTDLDGNSRVLSASTNGTAIIDIGAFEFDPASPPSPCLYLNLSNLVVTAAVGTDSATVTYPYIDATPTATLTCVPPSGSVFAAGTHEVQCTLTYGENILSNSFTVTVLVPPYVTNQTASLLTLAGSNVTLSVSGIGTLPMDYQWYFDGNAISGNTNASLTISNVQAANGGSYQVVLNNEAGSSTNQPILLRVVPAAAQIVSGPESITVNAGGVAVFNAGILGSDPMTFQWYKNGSILNGAAASQLTLSNVQAADAGSYQILVSNVLGNQLSITATLSVLTAAPTFVLQPVSLGIVQSKSAEFTSRAVGSDDLQNPIQYKWYFNDSLMSGQNSSNLDIASVSANNEGNYFVVASNAYGVTTSTMAQLTVYLPPSFQAGLSNQVVEKGANVSLCPSVLGTTPLFYNWNFNNLSLANTNSTLLLSHISMNQSGYYTVIVSNTYGSATNSGRVSVFPSASQVVAWGDDSGGQSDVPTNLDDVVAVAGGDYHSIALRQNGTLAGWGLDNYGQVDVPTNSLRFVSIASGANHNLAIREDGTVVAWGLDSQGQTDVPALTALAISVAAGDNHSLALSSSGMVTAWGDDSYKQTTLPPSLQGKYYWDWNADDWKYSSSLAVQAIAAKGNHSLALLTNNTVVAWGDDSFGQSSPPSDLSNVIAIAAGFFHSVALCSDGTVTVWGDNTFGQTNAPEGLSNVVAIAASDYATFALKSDGSIIGWGNNLLGETNIPATVMNAVAISSGDFHCLAMVPLQLMLQLRVVPNGIAIQWNHAATLQWAETVVGPYTDVTNQGYGWTNFDMTSPAKFFRLRR